MLIYLHDSRIEILFALCNKIYKEDQGKEIAIIIVLVIFSAFTTRRAETQDGSLSQIFPRSTSFPSESHPNLAGVQECLRLVKACEACPSRKAQVVTKLGHLKDLYASMNAFLQLPLTQQALCGKERLVGELMDDFLCLMDACGLVKDSLKHMREQHQTLQSMLRRGVSGLESGICAYQCSRKRTKKDKAKCLRLLRNMEKHVSSSNDNLDMVDQVFNVVRAVTVSTFNSLSSVISGRKGTQSIFSRLVNSMSTRNDEDGVSEIEKADAAIFRLHGTSLKTVSQEDAREARKLMEELDVSLSEVELELEDVFRCMIQAKVSLLNIVTGR